MDRGQPFSRDRTTPAWKNRENVTLYITPKACGKMSASVNKCMRVASFFIMQTFTGFVKGVTGLYLMDSISNTVCVLYYLALTNLVMFINCTTTRKTLIYPFFAPFDLGFGFIVPSSRVMFTVLIRRVLHTLFLFFWPIIPLLGLGAAMLGIV